MLIISHVSQKTISQEFVAALEAGWGRAVRRLRIDPRDPRTLLEGIAQLLMSPRPDLALWTLGRTGVLSEVMPEVGALIEFGDDIRHKDVFVHTLQVVRQSRPRLLLRFGALLHDIGKVPTRRFTPDGQVTFLGHPEIGARMFDKMARRLPFPDEAAAHIRRLIAGHLRPSSYSDTWTDSAVRRFGRESGEALDDLLDLARADITSKYEQKVRAGIHQITALATRLHQLQELDNRPKALPKGLGATLMQQFGLPPGPQVGRLMARLTALVEAESLPPCAPTQTYIDHVVAHPQLLQ